MEDKVYVLVAYYYDEDNKFRYSVSYDMHNLNIQLQLAYYRYRLANGEYNVAVMEASELYYLEQRETAYDDPHYYANETQKAIEEYDIMEWMKDYKKGKNNSEKC